MENIDLELCDCNRILTSQLSNDLLCRTYVLCPGCGCFQQIRNHPIIMDELLMQLVAPRLHPTLRRVVRWMRRIKYYLTQILRLIVALILVLVLTIAAIVMFALTFFWLKYKSMTARAQLNPEPGLPYLERPPERDFIREHRGEFVRERERERQRLRKRNQLNRDGDNA